MPTGEALLDFSSSVLSLIDKIRINTRLQNEKAAMDDEWVTFNILCGAIQSYLGQESI